MAKIPIEIQNNLDLYAQNELLRKLRADYTNASAKMETGAYSVKKLFSGIVEQINATIDSLCNELEAAIVPKENFADFENSLVTLDDYASFDTLAYYNELKKLRFAFYGVNIALLSIQDAPVKPVTPAYVSDTGILDSLDSREFIEQGASSPVFESLTQYNYYTVIEGDTLPSIAGKVFEGDISRWKEIAKLNSITDSELLDNNLAGRVLKVPTDSFFANSISNSNLVFESFFTGTDNGKLEKYNYGQDIELFEKRMLVGSTGDLKRVSGVKCVVQNIQSRFLATKGSLNPLQPEWGIEATLNMGDIPYVIMLDRLLTDLEYQAMLDGRVIAATVDHSRLNVNGDRIDVYMNIDLVGDKNTTGSFAVGGA